MIENQSGIYPVEYKVLIKPEEVKEITAGGIVIPEQCREKEEAAAFIGEVIEVGPMAFEDWPNKPQVGETVIFARYAGLVHKGLDEVKYRIMNDKDIIATIGRKQ